MAGGGAMDEARLAGRGASGPAQRLRVLRLRPGGALTCRLRPLPRRVAVAACRMPALRPATGERPAGRCPVRALPVMPAAICRGRGAPALRVSGRCGDQGAEVSPQAALCPSPRVAASRTHSPATAGYRRSVAGATPLAATNVARFQPGRGTLPRARRGTWRTCHAPGTTPTPYCQPVRPWRHGQASQPARRIRTAWGYRCASRAHRRRRRHDRRHLRATGRNAVARGCSRGQRPCNCQGDYAELNE